VVTLISQSLRIEGEKNTPIEGGERDKKLNSQVEGGALCRFEERTRRAYRSWKRLARVRLQTVVCRKKKTLIAEKYNVGGKRKIRTQMTQRPTTIACL